MRQTSETEGEVNFYMVGLPHIGDIPENGHVPVPHPHLLIVYRDTMRRVDGRWLIAEKRPLKTAFKSDMQLP